MNTPAAGTVVAVEWLVVLLSPRVTLGLLWILLGAAAAWWAGESCGRGVLARLFRLAPTPTAAFLTALFVLAALAGVLLLLVRRRAIRAPLFCAACGVLAGCGLQAAFVSVAPRREAASGPTAAVVPRVGSDAWLARERDRGELWSLSLDPGTAIGPEGWEAIGGMRRLVQLKLHGGRARRLTIPDEAWPHIAKLHSLRSLHLFGVVISRRGLEAIASLPSLEDAHLAWLWGIDPEDLAVLGRAPALARLSLASTGVGESVLPALASMPQLRSLALHGTDVEDAHLEAMRGPPGLESLSLQGLRVRGSGLAALVHVPRLRSLDLSECPLDDDGVLRLPDLADLADLDLSGTRVGDRGLAVVRRLPALRELRLSGTAVTDAGLGHLADLEHLHDLTLPGGVRGPGLRDLGPLPNLVWLHLDARPDATSLADFEAAHPGCVVSFGE